MQKCTGSQGYTLESHLQTGVGTIQITAFLNTNRRKEFFVSVCLDGIVSVREVAMRDYRISLRVTTDTLLRS